MKIVRRHLLQGQAERAGVIQHEEANASGSLPGSNSRHLIKRRGRNLCTSRL